MDKRKKRRGFWKSGNKLCGAKVIQERKLGLDVVVGLVRERRFKGLEDRRGMKAVRLFAISGV